MLNAQRCEHDGDKLDKLWEGWALRVSTCNIGSCTTRVCELVDVLANRWIDIACVQEISWQSKGLEFLVLKAKDINCFGWEVRSKLMV